MTPEERARFEALARGWRESAVRLAGAAEQEGCGGLMDRREAYVKLALAEELEARLASFMMPRAGRGRGRGQ